MANFMVTVDASDLSNEINRLKSVMTPKQFENAMAGIFRRTTGHVRMVLKKDLPHQYRVKAGEVQGAVSMGKVTHSGLGVGCTIPVRGTRGSIGGRYKAFGGAYGWESLHKKYRVKAHIVKGATSVLPKRMPGSYGGNPPFRNLAAGSLNGVAFTRKTKARFPIMKVTGIAIPQMPMNRSEPEVQKDIKVYLQKRMEQRFLALIRNGR